MRGRAIKYERDNIDTDVIIPGTYLKIHDYDELARHAMEGLDPGFAAKAAAGSFIVAGRNFGCGSSREHAPIALSRSGVHGVIAVSFARIFYRNSVDGAFLLPVEVDEPVYRSISDGDELDVDIDAGAISNLTTGQRHAIRPFPDIVLRIIRAGGLFKVDPADLVREAGAASGAADAEGGSGRSPAAGAAGADSNVRSAAGGPAL